jgi:hypothetical protein
MALTSIMQGATEMGAMEHLLNVYASKSAKHSVANFMGYAQVMPEEATHSLTQGLWLVSHQCEVFLGCGDRTTEVYQQKRPPTASPKASGW